MANQIEELINVPVEFWNDGVQFSKRCTKRKDTFDFRALTWTVC